jgi:prephenate dehydrogenase
MEGVFSMKDILTVGIVGLGLIGGSIAHALKRTGGRYRTAAWNRDSEILDKALSDGVVDSSVSPDLAEFQVCDIIFLCVPVYAMKDLLERIKPHIRPDCVITDVGSTKGDVYRIMAEMGVSGQFIGGHPLAGSEKSGYSAAKANLFENAFYVITPDENTADNNKQLLLGVIRDLKAIPLEMTPLEHDRVTAAISHVPHVVASLLVNLVNKLDGPNGYMKTIAAGGFKDITRIASSSPELWAGICLSNRDIILKTLSAMEGQLSDFCEILKDGNRDELIRFFKTARAFRNSIADMPKSIIERQYDIAVDVEDKPGIIATIATALARKGINIKNIGIVHSRENEEGALEIRFEDEESMRAGMETLSALGYGVKAR